MFKIEVLLTVSFATTLLLVLPIVTSCPLVQACALVKHHGWDDFAQQVAQVK